jgi:hypothetical protein
VNSILKKGAPFNAQDRERVKSVCDKVSSQYLRLELLAKEKVSSEKSFRYSIATKGIGPPWILFVVV